MLLVCSLFIIISCTLTPSKKANTPIATPQKFTTPPVPTMLTSPEQQAEFIVKHYWDNFNFTDTILIGRANYTEQAFVDFVNILSNVSLLLATKGIETLMQRAEADSTMYVHFMVLAEKYLYDPNSPMRNEEFYIAVLRSVIANKQLDAITKVRPQYQLELALKNRIGQRATDFEYTTVKGKKANLYSAKGDKILLFFYRPDCPSCKEVKRYVAQKGIDRLLTIVWVNPDTDTHLDAIYDLRASPTLYLLDKTKTILLKDASIEQIETHLKITKR